MSRQINNFVNAAPAEFLYVKSIHTGQNHTIAMPSVSIHLSDSLTKDLAQDTRVAPKQDYARVDTNFVNLNAHRGPDNDV